MFLGRGSGVLRRRIWYFSAVNTVKKTLKRRILLHKTPSCAVTSAMSGSYVCTRFLPVFVPGGLLFFNGGLLTLQGNSMCKPPGRLRLHCVRRGGGAETNSWERGRPQLRCISNHDNMASMTYVASRKLTMRNEKSSRHIGFYSYLPSSKRANYA